MKISWIKKINPLFWIGNLEEPKPPSWYEPAWSQHKRERYWLYVRNPLHNFMFYVIGIYDQVKSGAAIRKGLHPKNVFNPSKSGGFNFTYFLYDVNWIFTIGYSVIYLLLALRYSWVIVVPGLIALALILFLPCISYIGKYKFYLGWREKGNFGVKLTKNRDNI